MNKARDQSGRKVSNSSGRPAPTAAAATRATQGLPDRRVAISHQTATGRTEVTAPTMIAPARKTGISSRSSPSVIAIAAKACPTLLPSSKARRNAVDSKDSAMTAPDAIPTRAAKPATRSGLRLRRSPVSRIHLV